ncbi:MAG: adenylate cyclase [Pseudonocardiales bacterium]|nr:adenylate cyclase [Pseudonocardiales bacterium]MDT4942462.1 adenylate cyclase [Pseudonocardiales bacterium]
MADADDQQLDTSAVDVAQLLEHVEAIILGGSRKYTPEEVSDHAGVDRDEARRMWRALGFPTVGDHEVVFTDSDVGALRTMRELANLGLADEEVRLAVARLFGQTFSRLAAHQGQLLLTQINERPELLDSGPQLDELIGQVLPLLEELQNYTWRRQLAAYVARMAAQGDADVASGPARTVIGFADMSRFTALTRKVSETELRTLLDAFESLATEVVGQHGGRIVKTIGDEVLFQADDPASAAEIALELLEGAAQHPELPELRAGLALGPVVVRLGDVFGSTVNIASRLTSLARPGWVLIDRDLHAAIEHDPRFAFKSRRPEAVRGFHRLHSWRLMRGKPADEH